MKAEEPDLVSTDAVQVSPSTRLALRVRWIAVRGLAGVLSGVIVLGMGGRLVMLASRLLHPDAAGRFTENGNRIGEFTIEGTVALILFGGLFGGLIGGVVWVLVKQWIPNNPVLVGLGAAAIGGFALIEADNPDFVILNGPAIDLVLLLLLLFLFGVSLQWIDKRLDRRLPRTGSVVSTTVYTALVLLGAPAVLLTFATFLSSDQLSVLLTGIFLVIAGIASVVWWVMEMRGAVEPPSALQRVGLLAVAGAVVVGAVQVVGQVVQIL